MFFFDLAMKMDSHAVQLNRYNKAIKEKKAIRRKKAMKKMLVFLLGMVFALNLLMVIYMVSGCMSPRQVMYTFTDSVSDTVYSLNRGWNF